MSPDPNDPIDPITRFPFDNTYARLPERMYSRLGPTPVAAPRLVRLNAPLADLLGLDAEALARPPSVAVLAGNRVPDGAAPIALAYAGHQFGHFVPRLGDGRALLLGEIVGRDGRRRDLQLKGSGPTPYSRSGDGRAALGPALREYIVSEAMWAMGVPSTRALAVVTTGEPVYRETRLPGAILTRVAASHIRVGTFEYFAARRDLEALRLLADHAIARHDPECAAAAHPYRALLDGVVARQAELVARWQLVGFIHGVMNTDNTTISGETIDYGPCAFMDAYHPAAVFSSIDHHGRYAYANQPAIALWNLTRLAESLLPLLGDDEEAATAAARASLEGFGPRFTSTYREGMRAKLGLRPAHDDDEALAADLLARMAEAGADFTVTFRALCDAAEAPSAAEPILRAHFPGDEACHAWVARWRARLGAEPLSAGECSAAMRDVNPAYIPRNHLVEEAIAAAVAHGDFRPFETLVDVLATPYRSRPGHERHAAPPRPEERVLETFCGT